MEFLTDPAAVSRFAWSVLVLLGAGAHAERAPDLVLEGRIEAAEHRTYLLVPFEVPAGTSRLTVEFDYTGREARTTIDIGLLGPDGFAGHDGFRGWSGGNKRSFTIAAHEATPSYLSGPLAAGVWNLLLGIPNIREGQSAEFAAKVYFEQLGTKPAGATREAALKREPGWYRGDLHAHSGHSDGTCNSRSGAARVPCPLFLTLNAAAERGLDFVAITEHNTVSHVRELTASQPYFDDLLLIPGMEVTTFQGHANVFGLQRPIDFRVGSSAVPDWNAVLAAVAAQNAIVSINHPRVPSGERCMGCGWQPQPAADLARVHAIEVVNGNDVETPISGIPFWHEQLQRGFRMTAIGGSDTHDVTAKSFLPVIGRIGVPTTVVYAQSLSVEGIKAGVAAGHVFVDTEGTADRLLQFSAEHGGKKVPMGGELTLKSGETASFNVRIRNAPGSRIEIIRDGTVLGERPQARVSGDDHRMSFTERGDGKRHWVRIDVRDEQGRLLLLGNPIYLNRPAG